MLKAVISGIDAAAIRALKPPPPRVPVPNPPPREPDAPLSASEMVSLTLRAQLVRLFQMLSRPDRIPYP